MAAPSSSLNALLRRLPKVDEVLEEPATRALLERAPRWAVVQAVRSEIEALRRRLVEHPDGEPRLADGVVADRVAELTRPSLRPVLNATGVVLHTNLGRAPLSPRALDRLVAVAGGYCNLEYRLDEGRRGSRHEHLHRLLAELTGAEAALVVNNNAAAVLLALAAVAAGREVIVSRGELVEIGGSFRIPDVMRASGARLVEVGTTNRTHRRDYERAITDQTALLLKVHQSNFAQVGFTAEVGVGELAELGRSRGVAVMVDLGSGSLIQPRTLGLPGEPTTVEMVRSGADLVTCSGDKLLGGPQAGLILGGAAMIERLRGHPLLRAVRPDKLSLAALEGTLESYRDGRAEAEVPTVAMLAVGLPELQARAARLAALVGARAPRLTVEVMEVTSVVGGGALPLAEPPSAALGIRHPSLSAAAVDRALRLGDPPLVARVGLDRLLVDLRTLTDEELPRVAAALGALPEAT